MAIDMGSQKCGHQLNKYSTDIANITQHHSYITQHHSYITHYVT